MWQLNISVSTNDPFTDVIIRLSETQGGERRECEGENQILKEQKEWFALSISKCSQEKYSNDEKSLKLQGVSKKRVK